MIVYVLYTSYPYEGGYVHGIFTSFEEAKQAMDSDDFDYGYENTEIHEMTLDKFKFQEIRI